MSPIWKWPRRRRQSSSPTPQTFTGAAASEGKLNAHLTRQNGSKTLLVLCPDGQVYMFPHDHPNFTKAKELAIDSETPPLDSETYRKLFDVSERVKDLFGVITDRVRVSEGIVYFDEKEVHNQVTERIIQFMEEGREDFTPLAKFMENVEDNPNEKSKEALFSWLEANQLAIDEDGHIVCFKGVNEKYLPSRQGPGIVNGRDLGDNAWIEYKPGNIVSIERSKCDEGGASCSTGLHVANRSFADKFNGTPKTMEVRVNPRDVVSVRLDGREKIRACRLRVIGAAPPAEYFNKALRVGV